MSITSIGAVRPKYARSALCAAVMMLGVSTARIDQRSDGFRYPLRVYYFPFDAQTVVPITASTIKSKYDITSLVSQDAGEIERLARRANGSSRDGAFDGATVRLYIERFDRSPVLIDRLGGVRTVSGEFVLNEQAFKDLKQMIEECLPD